MWGDILSLKTVHITVEDMVCTSCEKIISESIYKLDGVSYVDVNYKNSTVKVTFETDRCSYYSICAAIDLNGYTVKTQNNFKSKFGYSNILKEVFSIMVILVIGFVIVRLGKDSGTFNIDSKLGKDTTYAMLFVVGIFTSLHCLGMCGGIMLSQSITIGNMKISKKLIPSLLYNSGRLISYTLLGGIVGAIGSVFSISLTTTASISIIAGLFMIIMGFNMSGFKLFRGITLKLPFTKLHNKKKSSSPFIVGLLNGFMPCGPLQTMQLYALASGSFLKGATSMFVFALGTIPLMLIFSLAMNLINVKSTKKLMKFSGILIILLGFIMTNRGLTVLGIQNFIPFINKTSSTEMTSENKATIENGKQVVKITATSSGYNPRVVFVQKGIPAEIIFDGQSITSCNNEVIFPTLNIKQKLKKGETKITLTPSDKDINYSCWMGMLSGTIKVVDNLDNVTNNDLSSAEGELGSNQGAGCCAGGGSTGSSQSQELTMYGLPLSQIPTERLVKKSTLSNNLQIINIKGTDNYFEPLVSILQTNVPAKLNFDLSSMSGSDGTYTIVESGSPEIIGTFITKNSKGTLDITLKKSSVYFIQKDYSVVGMIKSTDNLDKEDINNVRSELID